jgi:hypothetical protein
MVDMGLSIKALRSLDKGLGKKEYMKAYLKLYYQQHKEKIAMQQRKYYSKHKDEIKAYNKKYYQTSEAKEKRKVWSKLNSQRLDVKVKKKARMSAYYPKHREEYKARNERYRLLNKEKIRAYNKVYSQNHREEMRIWQRKWNQKPEVKARKRNNIQHLISNRLRPQLIRALNRYGNGKIQSSKKYGIDWNACCKKLVETKPLDFNERNYQIDHIKPLSSFDLTDFEQIKQAFSPDNLQWLIAEENRSKNNKLN